MIELLLLIVGFLAGFINAIAAGGALLVFPAMLYAGLSPLTATITGSLVVWPGQLSATIANKTDLKAIPRRYFSLLIPWMIGGGLGITLLNSTSHDTFNKIVPWLLAFTVIMFITQPYTQKHIHRPANLRPQSSTFMVWAGVFAIAIYAGYFGIGSGLMLLALFGYSRIKTIYQIVALKNLAGITLTLAATVFFASKGKIAWQEGLILAAGSIVGGYLGAHFTKQISERSVRFLVGSVGIVLVIFAFLKF